MTVTGRPTESGELNDPHAEGATGPHIALPTIVRDLDRLVQSGARFSTIYADPPWPYTNTAARGAAENHYRTLSLAQIRSEPVRALAAEAAHLHLWTTNAFLSEAFEVIRAWGFRYKSCLVWIKPQLGMGNYWRVSHEFLLLGVRGNLRFQDHKCRSWQSAYRTIHSRKPFLFRKLIERVSPGPYLELYGREEQPDCGWTVYGNQVERRLF
jgi:N6-adenosine-specific RNA methylase IME4